MDNSEQPSLPPHVEETFRAIQDLHTAHHSKATPFERGAARVTGLIARPAFVGLLSALIVIWIAGNLALRSQTGGAFDLPPFPWLEDALTLMALYMAALILITQKRADMLASHREQMTLQLAILSEQKGGKIIALIEELRRDSPQVMDRRDKEAEAMAKPVNHHAVSKVLEKIGPDDGGGKLTKAPEKN